MNERGTKTNYEHQTPPKVVYGRSDTAWVDYGRRLHDIIEQNRLRRVCEVGGGANPTLSETYVSKHDLDYTIVDVSPAELAKAPSGYRKVIADICVPDTMPERDFDLVFSKMVAEHIPDARAFHINIHRLLVRGGFAFHFFPTLYAFPFLVNRILPERASAWVLNLISPRDREKDAKFPAFYRWCRGPTTRQLARFGRLDFVVLEYYGFFGHGYYAKLPPVAKLHSALTTFLVRHPRPHLTSYAHVLLRKT